MTNFINFAGPIALILIVASALYCLIWAGVLIARVIKRLKTLPTDLMYVFNTRSKYGYLCRVPEFMAERLIKFNKKWDYAPTPEGL